jgi:hypothetical protein
MSFEYAGLTCSGRELEALNEEALQAKKELTPRSILPILSRIGRSRIDVDRLKLWNDRLGTAHKLLTVGTLDRDYHLE